MARSAISLIVAVLDMNPDARPRQREPILRTEQPNRNMADGTDSHHENNDDPDHIGVQRREGPHRAIRNDRQYHESRGGQQ
jgi:hypothetical protein